MNHSTMLVLVSVCLALAITGCASPQYENNAETESIEAYAFQNRTLHTATFAGGCFWCMESGFEDQLGVIEVISGYTGGETKDPTYETVSAGMSGHYEAVIVYYDPQLTSYDKMLESFWILIDPTDSGGQFSDRGPQYRTAIFYHTDAQKEFAEQSKIDVAKRFDKSIVTQILPAVTFYPAEEYHQNYAKKQQLQYKSYEKLSGRAKFIEENKETIDNMNEKVLREKLTPIQYAVTQEDGTEPPFDNAYWNNKQEGIYVDVVSGEPLFSSIDKYDSGTGWPSFSKPLESNNLVEKIDYALGVVRTEVRSKKADSHLGHVFDDGPKPTGLRYCMNSAALRFIAKENLSQEGYGQYEYLFD